MQRPNGALHQALKVASRGPCVTGSVAPHPSVKPCFRGASRLTVHAAQEAPAADSDDSQTSAIRRRRLFRGQGGAAGDSSSAGSSSRAPPRKPRTTSEPPRDVLQDFAAAFESTLTRTPKVGSRFWSQWGLLLRVIDQQCLHAVPLLQQHAWIAQEPSAVLINTPAVKHCLYWHFKQHICTKGCAAGDCGVNCTAAAAA
jgi:hypothetical protein